MAKGDLESLKDGAAQNHATERGAKQSLIAALGLWLGAEVCAPVDASEYVVPNPGPTSGGAYQVFSSAYNDQQHFAYVDANNNIQDVWWDGVDNQWNVQQLTGSSTSENVVGSPGPPAAKKPLSVSVYNNQQHFAYVDTTNNIQDVWYDGLGGWHLQQLTQGPPTLSSEYIVSAPGPTPGFSNWIVSVSVYNNQQHFSYVDMNNNIQDVWYDGSGG